MKVQFKFSSEMPQSARKEEDGYYVFHPMQNRDVYYNERDFKFLYTVI